MDNLKSQLAQAHAELDKLKKRLNILENRNHDLEECETKLKRSEERFRTFFETAGVSLWEYDYSDQKDILDSLREQDISDYRSYLNDNPDIVRELTSKTKLVNVNQKTLELYGAKSKEEILKKAGKYNRPEAVESFVESAVAYLEGKKTFRCDTVNDTLDGRQINVIIEVTYPLRESSLNRSLVAVMDITQLKKAEASLRESEEKHRLLSHLSSDYIYAARFNPDNSFHIDWVEGAFEGITGYTLDEVNSLDKGWVSVLHPYNANKSTYSNFKAIEGFWENEFRIYSKAGQLKHLFGKASISHEDNDELKIIGAVQDITDRVLHEKLQVSLAKVREAVWNMRKASDIMLVGNAIREGLVEQNVPFNYFGIQLFPEDRQLSEFKIYLVNNEDEWRLLEHSEGASKVLTFVKKGKTVYRRDLLANNLFEDTVNNNDMYKKVIRSVVDVPFSHGTIAVNSEIPDAFSPADIRILEEMAPLLSEGFKRTEDLRRLEKRTVALEKEVNERKNAEDELKQSEIKYRTLVERANDGVMITQDGTITFVNSKMSEIAGYSKEELLNSSLTSFLTPEDRPRVTEYYSKRLRGEPVPEIYELSVLHKDGRKLELEINSGMISFNNKPAAMAFVRDVTESKRLEEQLLIRERMDSLGTLAGGIAHDFNNLLSGIVGNLDLLKMDEDSLSEMQNESIDDANNACRRAAKLIRNFQSLTHGAVDKPTVFDIYEVASEVFSLLERTTNKLIVKKLDIKPGQHFIMGIPDQIHQVLLNLGTNAVQAIEEKGAAAGDHVRLALIDDGQTTALADGALLDTETVHMVFEDTGNGMNDDVRLRAFEPFFTTKERGSQKGQGLGLAMVYNIITRKHNGLIEILSAPGKGTEFHIHLPKADKALPGKLVDEKTLSGGSETVLIIDDEKAVRSILKKSLTRYGYSVETASDGEEGLAHYKAAAKAIDVVLLDLTMPKMSGDTVLAEIIKVNPAAKVILLSGHGEEEVAQYNQAAGYITKPYHTKQLIKKIRNVLDS